MKTSNSGIATSTNIVLSDSASRTPCERHDLALAFVRATRSENANLVSLVSALREEREEETWQRSRFIHSCDDTELPHYEVVGDWATALKAVAVAENDLSYAVGQIHFWWGTGVANTA